MLIKSFGLLKEIISFLIFKTLFIIYLGARFLFAMARVWG